MLGAIPSGMPEEGLDPSWSQAINVASANSMLFGEEVVFTYGPLASIVTGKFHPDLFWVHFFIVCLLSVVFATSLLRLQRTYGISTPILLLLIYYTIPGAVEYRFSGLVLVFFFAFLPEFNSNRTRRLATLLFAVFAFFPLVKGTLFIVWAASAVIFLGVLLIRRKYLDAVLLFGTQGIVLVLAILLSNQPLFAYTNIITGYFELSSGYSNAMSIPGVFLEAAAAAVTSIILGGLATWTYIRRPDQDGILITGLLTFVLLFLSFKSGFVRHDGHALMFWFTACVLVVLLWNAAEIRQLSLWGAVAPIGLLSLVSMTIYTPFYNPVEKLLDAPVDFAKSMTSILGPENHLAKLSLEYKTSIEGLETKYNVAAYCPGVSDVFPWEASAVSNLKTWNPRPIFQSYTAYTPKLRQRNIEHVQKLPIGARLIVSNSTIDGRIPLSDEPAIWWHFKSMYKTIATGSLGICIEKVRDFELGHIIESSTMVNLKLGDTLNLDYERRVSAIQVTIRQTLFGKLKSFLIKPTPIYAEFVREDYSSVSYRVIPVHDTNKFPLLIENDDQLVKWLEGEPQGPVRSIRIYTPRTLIPEYETNIELSAFSK